MHTKYALNCAANILHGLGLWWPDLYSKIAREMSGRITAVSFLNVNIGNSNITHR